MLDSLDEDVDDVEPDEGVDEEDDSVVFLCVRVVINFLHHLKYVLNTSVKQRRLLHARRNPLYAHSVIVINLL